MLLLFKIWAKNKIMESFLAIIVDLEDIEAIWFDRNVEDLLIDWMNTLRHRQRSIAFVSIIVAVAFVLPLP